MNELATIDPKEYGLEEKNVSQIEAAFMPKISERNGLSEIYNTLIKQEINLETCRDAGELRKKLVKVRTGIAEVHRSQKAFFLASGRFVDAWKNKETLPVTQMEENLSKIEKHFENIEKERLRELQESRVSLLSKYVEDAHERNLSSMDEDVWEAYLSARKKDYEHLIEVQRKLEEERLAKEKAEEEERERIRIENNKLKKEAEEREAQARLEQEKRDAEEAKRKLKEDQERKAHEAELKKERDERERVEKEARDNQHKLEAELRRNQEAEQKRIEEEERRVQDELKKGDSDKVKDLISDLDSLKNKYSFESKDNKIMYKQVGQLLDKIKSHINN